VLNQFPAGVGDDLVFSILVDLRQNRA